MDAPADHISPEESETLAAESREARSGDVALARELERPIVHGPLNHAGSLRALNRRAPLSRDAEERLLRAAQAGDRRAREQLVEAFLPAIAGVARLYRGSRLITRTELMQEGVVGLLRALARYDPDRGVAFWTYAAWWVRQAMQQLVAELTQPSVLSDRALRQLAQLRRAHAEHLQRHGSEPTGDELAAAADLPPAQVAELLAFARIPQSMEEPLAGADGELGAFGDLVVDPLAEDAYAQLLDCAELAQVRALLGSLNERERTILRARYGIDGPEQSLREIGERLGLSAERVRQIEDRALGKLRALTAGAPDSGERADKKNLTWRD